MIVAGAIAGVGIWWWQYEKPAQTTALPEAPAPAETVSAPPPVTLPEDNTSVINKELSELNIEELSKDFQGIDADINSL